MKKWSRGHVIGSEVIGHKRAAEVAVAVAVAAAGENIIH